MKHTWQTYINVIKNVVKPALGCTEPISAALASALVRQTLQAIPDSLDVYVSDNLYKNAKGVIVPGTGKAGLAIASAVGCISGEPSADLQVLAKITPEDVLRAQQLVDENRVQIHRLSDCEYIYCKVIGKHEKDICQVTIQGGHTRVTEIRHNANNCFTLAETQESKVANILDNVDINIEKIYQFALNADFNDIKFILNAATLNKQLSSEGLSKPYGLEIGLTLKDNISNGILSDDLMTQIQMRTAAASDARMGGASLPAMSNFGSGNQGIAATIPVTVAAEYFNASEEKLARALIMSHLGAIYIKSHYPPLSAFCGNTVTSAAAAMAIVYLDEGSFTQSCKAIQNVLSDSSGMICDGAKASCAMKICTSSTAAVRAYMMAKRDLEVKNQGVIGEDVEKSIQNIGEMVSKGMVETDKTIINLM